MRPRVAIVAYTQETSSFTTQRTTLDTFRAYGLAEGPAVLENRFNHEIGGFLHELQAAGFEWEPCPVIHATAGAHGPLTPATRTWFEERIVAGIRAAGRLDAVYLALHGAAAADDNPDTEGRLQELVREAVGPNTPIVLSLDHHANLTQRMVDGCDALVAHRTQPHAMRDTGQLAARLLMPILRGELQPTIAWRKIPLITHQEQFLTAAGPMKTWFDRARAMERLPGVASASTFPMQPWLDIPEGGWACAVVTDGDRELAERLAGELADLAWDLRDAFLRQESISPAEAVAQAIAADRGLVVLSDTGDSVWGGAAGDSTALLAELLRQRPSQMALVPMVDPVMAEQAARAGAGGSVRGPLGRALDPQFGPPVEIDAEVVAVGGGVIEVPVQALTSFDMGTACLLRSGSIYVVVSEHTGIGGNHPAVYEHFGLDVADAKMVVVKTASNWQYYGPWTSRVIRADTPGPTQSGLRELDWKHLPRPIYPLDPMPSWSASPP